MMAYTRTVAPGMLHCSCGAFAICEVFSCAHESLGYFCERCGKTKINQLNVREYPDWAPGAAARRLYAARQNLARAK